MYRTLRNWMVIFVLSLLLVGASTQQNDGPPWWIWLVAIGAVLLLVFIAIIALAWRDTGRRRGDK
jgi:hypothetical protein